MLSIGTVLHSTSSVMMIYRALLLLVFLHLPDLVTAPLPLRYVKRNEASPEPKPSRPPYLHPLLRTVRDHNDTALPQHTPIDNRDGNITALPKESLPLPPFLHPLLRNKRDVDEIVLLPDSNHKTNGDTKSSVPLPPYVHPILRCKRGVEDEDCSQIYNPSKTSQAGKSKTQQENEHEEEECYYHRERKSIHETIERPVHSQVKGCGGELRRMSELFFEEDTNLYGAPNKAAVIMARGGGEFIDWTDANKVEEVGKRFICRSHENELGSNWEAKHWYHFKRKVQGKQVRPVCSMPEPFFKHTDQMVLTHELYRIEAQEAEAILKKKGVLLHPGLPICAAHEQEARKIQAQESVEGAGHEIRPPPIDGDFSQTPDITKDVNPHFDPRDEKDPSYHPRHAEPPMGEEKFDTQSDASQNKAYLALMKAFKVPPHISKTPWHELSERTQRRQAAAFKYVATEIAKKMNSDNPDALIEKTFKHSTDYERPRSKEFLQMMENLKEALESSDSRADRLAYLSLVTRLSLPEVRRYISGISSYFWDQAKKYAKRGYYIEIVKNQRIKYSFAKVERFIEFLTSYKVTIGLPYGTRRVRDSQRKWVEIPNTLRKLRSGEIYDLYKKELEDGGEQLLLIPESTARKMIHICSAEKRKSLHGVDVTIADAMEAFDNAGELIDSLVQKGDIEKGWHTTLRSEMLQGRQYIRTDYLIHAKEASRIGDHCWSFGLSDPDDLDFQQDCPNSVEKHTHSLMCDKCEILQIFFGDLRATLESLERRTKKNPLKLQEIAVMRRDLYDWEDKITKLKAHQLRTAKSEVDRQWIISDLEDGDVLMTVDFAMKHMPLRGREPTTDWYGQRGMPWHVTHATTYINGDYYQHNLVHILHGDRQDSATVTAIIRHSLEQLKSRGITRVFLRSDQAGAYKSSSTLASIRSIADEVGINVVGWYFSEAQAGKGPCDRSAATTKMITRNFADAGGKVTTPLEFYEAVTNGRVYTGRSYYLVKVEGSKPFSKAKLSPTKITDLSKYSAFSFEKDGLRFWRYWNIGRGKTISHKNMVPNDAKLAVTYSGGALSNDNFWMKMGERQTEEQVEEKEEQECDKRDKKCKNKPKPESKLFRCPIETCSKEFLTEKGLENHMTVGKHLQKPEKENVLDYALHRFGAKLETDAAPRMCPIIDEAIDSLTVNTQNARRQPMGWALPKRRKSTRFPKEVKDFLKKIYDEGDRTGVKTDAHEAEKLMRNAKNDDGTMIFLPDHLLNSRQIAGVYAGFKKTKLDKRDRVRKEAEPEPDEVNDLFDMEGDPDLEYKTEPLFDEVDLMRKAIKNKSDELFDGEVDHDQELKDRGIKPVRNFRGWLGGAR